MSGVSTLGLIALVAMVVLYALEDRSPVFLLLFALASIAAALGDLMNGSWLFGVVALCFAPIALWRWWQRQHGRNPVAPS